MGLPGHEAGPKGVKETLGRQRGGIRTIDRLPPNLRAGARLLWVRVKNGGACSRVSNPALNKDKRLLVGHRIAEERGGCLLMPPVADRPAFAIERIAFSAALCGLLFGYDTAVIAGAL